MSELFKPTVDEILELKVKVAELYSGVYEKFKQDDIFYELEFKERLKLPDEFVEQGVVLPTGRDMVDTCVDNTDIANARVFVNKKGTDDKDEEQQEMMRKLYLGLIHRTAVENSISPWRVMAKHYWLYGVAVAKTVWDLDRRPDAPKRKPRESDEAYNERADEWRAKSGESLPVVIQAVNPQNIMIDPYNEVPMFIFEIRERNYLDIKSRYKDWTNPKDRGTNEKVEQISFWTPNYRCELMDEEPVLKGGVVEHDYGFLPYVLIDTGLGNLSADGDMAKRYVGILRYIQDVLISESRDYSISDIILSKEAWPWGTIEGPGAMTVGDLDQTYGTWTPMPKETKLVAQTPQLPPQALFQQLNISSSVIASHAAPNSVRGLGEAGVRSGTDRSQIIAQAALRYRYSQEAFRNGTAKILTNCARLIRDVVPGDIRVWARTPYDEFDVKIDRRLITPPFTCYVEFGPESEETEYRQHDDLERLVESRIATVNWARKQMSSMNPKELEIETELQKLLDNPELQKLTAQLAAGELTAALSRLGLASQVANPTAPQVPPQGPTPQPGAMPMSTQQPPRARPQVPVPGSAPAMQNQMRAQRRPVPVNPNVGRGGGGNRP